MDYQKMIGKQAIYRKTLAEVGQERNPCDYLPEDVVENLDDDKYYPLSFSILIPLHDTIAFIVNNRLILENIENFMNQDNGPILTPQEVYDKLRPLLPYVAETYIRTIDCNTALLDTIISDFFSGDRERFCNAITNNDLNLYRISNLCHLLWERIDVPQNITFEEWHDILNALVVSNLSGLDEDVRPVFSDINTLNDIAEEWNDPDDDAQYGRCSSQLDRLQQTHIAYLLHLYWDDPKIFTARERKLIEDITHRPAADGLYDILRQQYDASLENGDFELPPDYFTLKNETTNNDDIFTLRYDVVKAGPEKLTALINYLSDCGYISHSVQVKQTLAYRLTGKMRPQHLEPIEWTGRNGKSYELIYLVKTLSERGSYKKMRRFFFGPQWPDSESSYAKSAAYEFKLFVHQLYPTLPDML